MIDVENLARKAGIDRARYGLNVSGNRDGVTDAALFRFAALVLEAAAQEFDRRDNGSGFYDPNEPAEIIRAMKPQCWPSITFESGRIYNAGEFQSLIDGAMKPKE